MRRKIRVLAVLASALLLSACGQSGTSVSSKGENEILVYYMNESGNGLHDLARPMPTGSDEEKVDALLDELQTVPPGAACQQLFSDDVKIRDLSLSGHHLTIDFSSGYNRLESTQEVLVRAGVVRTLVQMDCVDTVSFTVGGKPAKSANGKPLGVMTADTFVEDAGKMINAIQHTSIDLYFTDSDGDSLTRESRSIYYSASKPIEWAIVERIIAGPKVEGNYATVPTNLQILSVVSSNGIAYVNLNDVFESSSLQLDAEIPVYSIVNSICANCPDVKEVQFAINGDSNVVFRQHISFEKPIEPDMTLIKTE